MFGASSHLVGLQTFRLYICLHHSKSLLCAACCKDRQSEFALAGLKWLFNTQQQFRNRYEIVLEDDDNITSYLGAMFTINSLYRI